MRLNEKSVETDVLVIGTGAAGCFAAMKAHELDKYLCDTEELEVEIVPEGETVKVKKTTPAEDAE